MPILCFPDFQAWARSRSWLVEKARSNVDVGEGTPREGVAGSTWREEEFRRKSRASRTKSKHGLTNKKPRNIIESTKWLCVVFYSWRVLRVLEVRAKLKWRRCKKNWKKQKRGKLKWVSRTTEELFCKTRYRYFQNSRDKKVIFKIN